MRRNMTSTLRRSLLVVAAAGLLSTTVTGAAVAGPPTRSPLQQSLNTLVTEEHYPAALAWTSKNGRTTSLVAGSSRRDRQVPVPHDGQVRAGSNTKTFTAVVVLQLVAEGKVRLDASVERYLPDSCAARASRPRRSPCGTCCSTPAGSPTTPST